MTKGTSLVVRKPERSVSPFQFLMPLSHVVWITIFVAYVFTALMLFGVSRINCDKHDRCLNNFNESFWYIWGTLLRGNLQRSPTGISSRIVSSTWWFFSLIVISVYTANLAAFLTISNAHMPITSAADRSWGSVGFFVKSNVPSLIPVSGFLTAAHVAIKELDKLHDEKALLSECKQRKRCEFAKQTHFIVQPAWPHSDGGKPVGEVVESFCGNYKPYGEGKYNPSFGMDAAFIKTYPPMPEGKQIQNIYFSEISVKEALFLVLKDLRSDDTSFNFT